MGLIKIDIEGHDFEALRGMEQTVANFRPLILTECELSPELNDLCSRWNYRIFAFFKEQGSLKTHFRECRGSDRENCWTKMLFLAPENLHSAFVNLIEG